MPTEKRQSEFDIDTPLPSVFDLAPEEHAALELKLQRAIENGLVPKVPPNLFRHNMDIEEKMNEPDPASNIKYDKF